MKILVLLGLSLLTSCGGHKITECSGPWQNFPQPMPQIVPGNAVQQTMVQH